MKKLKNLNIIGFKSIHIIIQGVEYVNRVLNLEKNLENKKYLHTISVSKLLFI